MEIPTIPNLIFLYSINNFKLNQEYEYFSDFYLILQSIKKKNFYIKISFSKVKKYKNQFFKK